MTLNPEQLEALGKFTPPFKYDKRWGEVRDSRGRLFVDLDDGEESGPIIASLLNSAVNGKEGGV